MVYDKTGKYKMNILLTKKNTLMISLVSGNANPIIFILFLPEAILTKKIVELFLKRNFVDKDFTIRNFAGKDFTIKITQNRNRYSLFIHISRANEFLLIAKNSEDKDIAIFPLTFQNILRLYSFTEASIGATLSAIKVQSIIQQIQQIKTKAQKDNDTEDLNEEEVNEVNNEVPFSLPTDDVDTGEIPF